MSSLALLQRLWFPSFVCKSTIWSLLITTFVTGNLPPSSPLVKLVRMWIKIWSITNYLFHNFCTDCKTSNDKYLSFDDWIFINTRYFSSSWLLLHCTNWHNHARIVANYWQVINNFGYPQIIFSVGTGYSRFGLSMGWAGLRMSRAKNA